MANRRLFKTQTPVPVADTRNHEGAKAYSLPPKHALAQMLCTSLLQGSFYASEEAQLQTIMELMRPANGEPLGYPGGESFALKAAVYAREVAYMKETPALILAMIFCTWPEVAKANPEFSQAFSRICNNGTMLRNFVQMVRSGRFGRRSFGTVGKRLIRNAINARNVNALFRDSVGTSPSIGDILKLVHPKPDTPVREALYRYLIGKPVDVVKLPDLVQRFEAWKLNPTGPVPEVPFQMVTNHKLSQKQWTQLAVQGGWHFIRMNLNTLLRNGVLSDPTITKQIADRLRDPALIARSRVFPFQILNTLVNVDQVPAEIRNALHDALDIATGGVLTYEGSSIILVDISGSMDSALTQSAGVGYGRATGTQMSVAHVASVYTAALLKKNPNAPVIGFNDQAKLIQLEARDTVMTNAQKIREMVRGGTNLALALDLILQNGNGGLDTIFIISDNQSWMDDNHDNNGTGAHLKFQHLRRKFGSKLKAVCIDIAPNTTAQLKESPNILNLGGYSDNIWKTVSSFLDGTMDPNKWVAEIEAIQLQDTPKTNED